MREGLEEARERYFWGMVLRGVWMVLALASAAGVLAALTVALGWTGPPILRVLGIAAGACLAVGGAGSALARALTAAVTGALGLPLLAAHLAAVSVRSEAEAGAEAARLAPFLAYAAGALLAGLAVATIWRGRPARPRAEAEAEPEPEAAAPRPAAARESAAPPAQEVST